MGKQPETAPAARRDRGTVLAEARAPLPLVDQFQYGLAAPICLTWELTYACNLACVHCLSSSGRRDPRELSTAECRAVIDELDRMQVFYVNIGGGEPTVRPDFWALLDYATAHHVGVKFSTNGVKVTPTVARLLAASDYVDVQISLDGATAEVNDAVRGTGSYVTALRAPIRPWRGRVAGPPSHGAAAAAALRLADRPRRAGPDGRLVLSSRRVRQRPARPEHVRRRAGRLPDRPGGRCLCLPVHHSRRVPGRERPRARRFRRSLAGVGAVR